MKGKILVIEDDKNWQNLLKNTLEKAGFYVTIASDLEAGISKMRQELFHFMTIDLQLEEKHHKDNLEGFEIIDALKKLRIDIRPPAIVVTGFEKEYWDFNQDKNLKKLFFMGKGNFDKQEFLAIIQGEIDKAN